MKFVVLLIVFCYITSTKTRVSPGCKDCIALINFNDETELKTHIMETTTDPSETETDPIDEETVLLELETRHYEIDFNDETSLDEFEPCYRNGPSNLFEIKSYADVNMEPYRNNVENHLGNTGEGFSCVQTKKSFDLNTNTEIESAIFLNSNSEGDSYLALQAYQEEEADTFIIYQLWSYGFEWNVINGLFFNRSLTNAKIQIYARMSTHTTLALEYLHVTLASQTDPTEEATDPTEEATDPTEEATDPTEEITDSTTDVSDPTETDQTKQETDTTETDPTEEITDPTESKTDTTETDPTETDTTETDTTEDSTNPSETDQTEDSTNPSETDQTEQETDTTETDQTESETGITETNPTEEKTEPTETDPIEEITDPTEEITDTTEEITDPTEEINDPTEKITDATENETDPTENETGPPTYSSSIPTRIPSYTQNANIWIFLSFSFFLTTIILSVALVCLVYMYKTAIVRRRNPSTITIQKANTLPRLAVANKSGGDSVIVGIGNDVVNKPKYF